MSLSPVPHTIVASGSRQCQPGTLAVPKAAVPKAIVPTNSCCSLGRRKPANGGPTTAGKAREKGFTLVEVVISLTVLSLIVLGTLTAMRTLADTHEHLNETTDRVDEMRQVSQFLRNSLRQMRGSIPGGEGAGWAMARYGDDAGLGAGLIRGEPREVIWTAPLDSIQGISGMSHIRLYRDRDTLKLQFLPATNTIEDLQSYDWSQLGDGYVLASDVDVFSLSYRLTATAGWQDNLAAETENGAIMPAAISITIRAKGRYWPEILVSPYGASG